MSSRVRGAKRDLRRWLLGMALSLTSCGGVLAQPLEPIWQKPIEVAAGPAERGPWQQNDSQFHFVDDPTVALSRNGDIAVAWVDQTRKDVFYQAYTAQGEALLASPVNVSASGDVFSWLPRVVLDTEEPMRVYVLWQEIVFSGGSHGGETFFARSDDGGRTFSKPLNLSRSMAGDGKGRLTKDVWHNGSLDLVQAPSGDLYAAWTAYEGTLWFSRSDDGGASFSEPMPVFADASLPAGGPTLAAGEAGVVYLAWGVGHDPEADIYFTSSQDGGRSFEPPRVLFDTAGHAWAPKLAVGAEGTVYLVYGESEQGRSSPSAILYTHALGPEVAFVEPRVLATGSAAGFAGADFPDFAADAHGRLMIAWGLFDAGGQRPKALGYTLSTDGGETFRAPKVMPHTVAPEQGFIGSTQGLLMDRLAMNADGSVALVNSIFLTGQSSRIWLHIGQL